MAKVFGDLCLLIIQLVKKSLSKKGNIKMKI